MKQPIDKRSASKPLLKVCGLTTIADLRLARAAGANFLGLIIEAPGSPRSLSLPVACRLAGVAEGRAVAVCVSDQLDFLRQVCARMKPRAIQLHSSQAAALASELTGQTPVWVVVSLPPAGEGSNELVAEAQRRIEAAAAAGVELIVLDTAVKGQAGGTGVTSNWELAAAIVAASPLPVLLAGGIGPENAVEALRQVRPAGLDASSRLEQSPGRKDPHKLCALREALAKKR